MTLNDYQKAAERTSGNLTSWEMLKRIGVDVEAWNKERKEPDETEKH